MKPSCLFVGFGQIASRVYSALEHDVDGWMLKRTAGAELPVGIRGCFAGDVASEELWEKVPADVSVVLFCVTPNGRSAEAYRQVFYEGMQNCIRHFSCSARPPHILFVSSTSVYSQDQGEELSELSVAEPVSESAQILRETEMLLEHSGLSHTIVRFSGIYGAQRLWLVNQVLSGQPVLSQSERLSNRIHEDDAVGFLVFVMRKVLSGQQVENLFIASDSMPCDLNEVYRFIGRQLGVDLLEIEPGKEPARRTGNKRLSNKRMLDAGYSLLYPDYEDGYKEMCARTVTPGRSEEQG